jgi:hypothetical protein
MKKLVLLLTLSFTLRCESMEIVAGRHGSHHCSWEDSITESYTTLNEAEKAEDQYMTAESGRYRKCRIYRVEEEEVGRTSGEKK